MRSKKHVRNTPEEALRQAVESRMELEFDYKQIQDRLDLEEIARVGEIRHQNVTKDHSLRSVRRPAVATVLATLLILGGVLGAGGVLIARLTDQPNPPVVPPENTETVSGNSTPSHTSEEATSPLQTGEIEFTVDDTLIWDGVIYTRTNVMIPSNRVGDELGIVEDGSVGLDDPDRTQSPFASASLLEVGSVFHRIQAHREDRYLAVLTSEGYILYMVRDAQSPDLP